MLTSEKAKEIAKKLANSKSVTILVDQNSNLRVKKRKNMIRVEGLNEIDREYLIETVQFYLPYLKIK